MGLISSYLISAIYLFFPCFEHHRGILRSDWQEELFSAVSVVRQVSEMSVTEMKACRGFKWRTELAHGNRSSDFRVGNCEWYLTIKISRCIDVLICPKQIQDTEFRPFEFTSFYNYGSSNKPKEWLLKRIDSPKEHWLYVFSFANEIPRWAEFVFIFDEGISLELRTESDKELPVSDLTSLSSDFGALLASGDSSDVKLKTESGIRSAHRSVLASRSEVFSAMFRNEMKESTSGLVEIKDMDGTVFDHFLGYIYTGEIPGNLDDDTLVQLYSAADKYDVHCLKKQCVDVLSRCVTQENHQALLVLAVTHSDETLKSAVIDAIVPDWVKCEEWQQFSKQHQALATEVFFKLLNKTC